MNKMFTFKKLAFVAAMLITGASSVFAQNVKDEWVKVSYLQLPRHPFAENVKTFSTQVIIPDGLAADQNRSVITANLEKAAEITGYEKVTEGGDLVTEVSLGWFNVTNYELITTPREEKRGDKKVMVDYFSYRLQFRYPMRVRVLQGDQVIEDTFVNSSNDYKYANTAEFKSKSELYAYWESGAGKFKSDTRDTYLNNNTAAISKRLKDQYSYVKSSMREEVKFVKEKKGATDYAKLTKAFETVSASTPKKLEDDIYPSADFIASMEEAMTLWKEELAESDPSNRKARIDKKVTEAILKNLAVTCYLTYKFDEAAEYLTRLEEMKEGAWASNMREKIADVQYRLTQYEKIYAQK